MLKAGIQILITLLNNPKKLLRVLDNPENEFEQEVILKYGLKSGLPIVEMEEICGTSTFDLPTYLALEGGSTPFDLMLLRSLASKQQVVTFFEIGTWRGESAVAVTDQVEKVFTLNLPETEMRKRAWPEDYIKQSGMLTAQHENIQLLAGDSLRFDFKPYHQTCDLIFVDGDHHYRHVLNDTQKAFQLRRNEDSIIVWHDYGFSPEVIRWEVLGAILEGTPQELRNHLFHVANTKCAVFCTRPLKSAIKQRPVYPDKAFSVTTEIRNL